jgi:hypothetical protein
VANIITNKAKERLQNGQLDLDTDTIKCVLIAGQKTGGATTSSSAVATMTSTTGLAAGMEIVHANFPAGTKINTVDSGTQVTMSANATATGSSLTFVFTPGRDQNFISEWSGIEVSTTGYTGGFGGSGRKSLANKTVAEDDTLDLSKFDADDVTWTAIGPATSGPIITSVALVKEGTADSDSLTIGNLDLTARQLNGGDYTIVWSASGLITLS